MKIQDKEALNRNNEMSINKWRAPDPVYVKFILFFCAYETKFYPIKG